MPIVNIVYKGHILILDENYAIYLDGKFIDEHIKLSTALDQLADIIRVIDEEVK